IERNVRHLIELTHKLEAIARMRGAGDNAIVQQIGVAAVAEEAARQVREMAEARNVDVRIVEPLPTLTVDVGRLEHTLINLLSNAIKYSDPEKPARYVEVTGAVDGDESIRIQVAD